MSTPISGSSGSAANNAAVTSALLSPANSGGAANSTGSAPPISFGGLVSGINTSQIEQALLAADQAPILALQGQQAHEQGKLAAWQDLNTKLQAVHDAAFNLSLQSTVGARKVSFGGPSGTFASGTASPDATNGSFTLEIDNLATATQVISTAGAGAAITGTDVATSSSKLPQPVTAGSFTVSGKTITVTAGETFDQILTDIGTQTAGAVTASIVGNTIQLTSTNAQPITLGSGGDTSNFLTIAKLLGQPSDTTMTSSGPVGMLNPNVVLDQANLNGFTSSTSGSFNINGVSITYNSAVDSLQAVIDRINASAAGVTASYNANSDTITLTASKTGNVDMSLADASGNLLSSLNLGTAGAHHVGSSAKYEVNGGPAQFSLSNTVNDLVPGVNVTLQAVTALNAPVTGTVTTDPSVGEKAIQSFVTAYNAVVDTISKDTAFDANTRAAGIFLGDSTITTIQTQLDQGLFISNGLASGLTPPFIDISTIGLSTGQIGSQPGTTNDLQFDTSTFESALSTNPTAAMNLVNKVFQGLTSSVNGLIQPFGVVDSAIQSENQQISDLQTQISDQQLVLQQQQDILNTEFTSLDTQLAQLQSQSAAGASALALLASNGSGSTSSSSTPSASSTAASGTSGA